MSAIARIIARNVTPAFEHDCSACVFLGSLDGVDLYACNRDGSLIRRFSSTPSDNGSLPSDIAPRPGSPYAFAAALLARSAVSTRFIGNAYRSKGADLCDGCEHCDGEGGHLSIIENADDDYACERRALARAYAADY